MVLTVLQLRFQFALTGSRKRTRLGGLFGRSNVFNLCSTNDIADPRGVSGLRASQLRWQPPSKGAFMLWVLAVLMGGLGFGYVTIRRKRKADKRAA
jgi:hypothetical protein